MTLLTTLFSGAWQYILGALALAAIYFGGKKIGKTEEKAKADVAAAEKDVAQVEAVAQTQAENIKVAKNVQQQNTSLSESAARDKLRQSKYNSPD